MSEKRYNQLKINDIKAEKNREHKQILIPILRIFLIKSQFELSYSLLREFIDSEIQQSIM